MERVKWEYLHLIIDRYGSKSELDIYGDEGWDMVSVVLLGSDTFFYFFKRPKQDTPDDAQRSHSGNA